VEDLVDDSCATIKVIGPNRVDSSHDTTIKGNLLKGKKKELSPEKREELLRALKARFEKNMNRHKGLEWAKVKTKLEAKTEQLWSLNEMERTGGEPDVVGYDKKTGKYIFF
jgi:transcription initiation factor TFIIIB Brf1 subunit/transcription initiation factor TFIIB